MSLSTISLRTALVLLLAVPLTADELPIVEPAEVGMSAEGLAKVDEAVEKLVADRQLAGAVVIVARNGKVVHLKSYGQLDIEADKPMRDDAIFRIYSMTKSITSAAALMLVDDGKLALDDPVSKYIPEFEGLQVFADDGNVDAEQPMTVRDLLRHTSGLTYGFYGSTPVDRRYLAANLLDYDADLSVMMTKLAEIPLVCQPGSDWVYSVSTDVLGRVVEVASGQPLDEFFRVRIFEPLDMRDTSFFVPADKLDRFAANYTSDGQGNLTLRDAPSTSRFAKPPQLFSGGGGLVCTARDYMRFLVMVSQGGELQGKRLLSKESIEKMTTNQLPAEVGWIQLAGPERQGVGFGLGFSVRVEDDSKSPSSLIGDYGWGGAASTHYWVSPQDDLVVVTLEQTIPFNFRNEWAVKPLIQQAIIER